MNLIEIKDKIENLSGKGAYDFSCALLGSSEQNVEYKYECVYLTNKDNENFVRINSDGSIEAFLPSGEFEISLDINANPVKAFISNKNEVRYMLLFEDNKVMCYDPISVLSAARKIKKEEAKKDAIFSNLNDFFGEPIRVDEVGIKSVSRYNYVINFVAAVKNNFPKEEEVQVDSRAGRGTYEFLDKLTNKSEKEYRLDGEDVYLSVDDNNFVRVSEDGTTEAFLYTEGIEMVVVRKGASMVVGFTLPNDMAEIIVFEGNNAYYYLGEKYLAIKEQKDWDGSVEYLSDAGISYDQMLLNVGSNYNNCLDCILDYVNTTRDVQSPGSPSNK